MPSVVEYLLGIETTSPAPTGAGGELIDNNFRRIADLLLGLVPAAVAVDMTAVAATTIFTVPTGWRFRPTTFEIQTDLIDPLSGLVQGGLPSFSLGVTGDLDSLMPAQQMNIDEAEVYGVEIFELTSPYLAAGTAIKIDVTVAFAGTSFDSVAILRGVLIPEA
jgi:hypothetical protein